MVKSVGPLESRKDYKDNPHDQYEYWLEELKSSWKTLEKWHKQGNRIVQRFVDERSSQDQVRAVGAPFRLNLFHSNTATLAAMLYGKLPKVDVSRRYADPNDDVSRVAAETIERLLNYDIANHGEEFDSMLKAVLQDRLLPGNGVARVRYEMDTETVETENGPVEQVSREDAPVEYYHWRDVCWGWGRMFSELPWVAFRAYLSKDEVRDRFGEEAAEHVELKRQRVQPDHNDQSDPDKDSAWNKAEIWEVWDKQKRKVVWISPQYDKILDTKPDPLRLNGFYPCPPFFMANPTTSLYMPTPDFHMAQDLYNEIDILQTRISIITEAVKVVGVYDASAAGIKRMFKEGVENELIAVDNWALFAEKGGIQGQIDWVPVADIVNALDKLRALRDESIGLLQQITGMSDIMRGELGGQYEGVGQSQMKAKFASIRIQALQDDFAQFASDLFQIKAEVIAKHFDPETILKNSNMEYSYDRELIGQAITLIKNFDQARLKVEVRPESVAMVDYAQLKQERTEYITAVSTYVQSIVPLIQAEPAVKPLMLQLLQWGLSGFKGANEIEGILDKAIEAAKKQGEEDKPNPEKEKAEAQQQLEQMKLQIEMQKIQAKAQADMQVRQNDLEADIKTAQAQTQNDLRKVDAELQAALFEISAKLKADVETEMATSQINAEQQRAGVEAEVEKDVLKTTLEIEKMAVEADLDMAVEKAKPRPESKPDKEAD